jgi:hypothetical protein
MKQRVVFILKEQLGYHGSHVPSKGLFNSAQFVVNALRDAGVEARLVEVIDNNDIDRVLTLYRPTHCIIEALWVVPEKFEQLQQLHPRVKFVVRIHSKTPFLASEGIALEWLKRYDVRVGFNSLAAARELGALVKLPLAYLPNVYLPGCPPSQARVVHDDLHVGCLGAIRPLKNHLLQALAAIEYAEVTNRALHFHVNTGREEQGREPV